ncbi:MAG: hypothetical protein QOJ06_290 [Pseudonocardiales bacterium]|jgi:hypothetical protein|nr:hypothetical protein [Pseudonocardiales bacterium]
MLNIYICSPKMVLRGVAHKDYIHRLQSAGPLDAGLLLVSVTEHMP